MNDDDNDEFNNFLSYHRTWKPQNDFLERLLRDELEKSIEDYARFLDEQTRHQDAVEQELAALDSVDYLVEGMTTFPDAEEIIKRVCK